MCQDSASAGATSAQGKAWVGAYRQQEEGDEVQAFVAVAILRDLVLCKANVGGCEQQRGECA